MESPNIALAFARPTALKIGEISAYFQHVAESGDAHPSIERCFTDHVLARVISISIHPRMTTR
jgi:hypothetical protein